MTWQKRITTLAEDHQPKVHNHSPSLRDKKLFFCNFSIDRIYRNKENPLNNEIQKNTQRINYKEA
jgi:hypothetical protein